MKCGKVGEGGREVGGGGGGGGGREREKIPLQGPSPRIELGELWRGKRVKGKTQHAAAAFKTLVKKRRNYIID